MPGPLSCTRMHTCTAAAALPERCLESAALMLIGSIFESVPDHIAQHPAQSVLIGPHGQVFWQIETDSIGMHFSWIKAC